MLPVGSGGVSCSIDISVFDPIQPAWGIGKRPTMLELTITHTFRGWFFAQVAGLTTLA